MADLALELIVEWGYAHHVSRSM